MVKNDISGCYSVSDIFTEVMMQDLRQKALHLSCVEHHDGRKWSPAGFIGSLASLTYQVMFHRERNIGMGYTGKRIGQFCDVTAW